MIDNPKQVTTLMQSLKTHLPIPAKATDALIRNLRNSPINISSNAHMEIMDVMYMGDEGGICCALKILDQDEVVVVVSLTHLRLPNTSPLSPDVLAYQTLRTKKLSRRR
jgi:hypothetical protein